VLIAASSFFLKLFLFFRPGIGSRSLLAPAVSDLSCDVIVDAAGLFALSGGG